MILPHSVPVGKTSWTEITLNLIITTPTHQISSGTSQISSGAARKVLNCVELDGSALNHFMIYHFNEKYQCLLIGCKLTLFPIQHMYSVIAKLSSSWPVPVKSNLNWDFHYNHCIHDKLLLCINSPNRNSIFEPLPDYLGSWNLLSKFYSTKPQTMSSS